MKTIELGKSGLQVPKVALGCMRIADLSKKDAEAAVNAALAHGINFFDHADIYGAGRCEEVFAEAVHMSPSVREKLIIQSKAGIVPGKMFDFSKEHIIRSVEGSLKRLKTDYLDAFLLHRPDALMEPEEVADAFNTLHNAGKVRHFGVSNQNPMQIALLKRYVKQPIVANQLQFSITNAHMINAGLHVNMMTDEAIDRDGSILDYCRLEEITIQPWSPFMYGFFEGVFLGSEKFPELNAEIDALAEQYNVSNTTIAIAWILRHPANMQPIVGTMNAKRIADCAAAADIVLTREEWYAVFKATGNTLP